MGRTSARLTLASVLALVLALGLVTEARSITRVKVAPLPGEDEPLLQVRGDRSANHLTVTLRIDRGRRRFYQVREPSSVRAVGPGCRQSSPTSVTCLPPGSLREVSVSIDGGAGDDTVATDLDFSFFSRAVVLGGAGDDELGASNGRDLLMGGAGADVLNGGADPDRMIGGGGDDRVSGFEGRDEIRGLGGRDVLQGGEGNDLMVGGRSRDRFTGGDGEDVFHAEDDFGDGRIVGGPDEDFAYIDRFDPRPSRDIETYAVVKTRREP